MADSSNYRTTSHMIKTVMLLVFLLFNPGASTAASTVGDIEYDNNGLTPTEQQGGSSNGINLNPLDWDWGQIGEIALDGLKELWDGAVDVWDGFVDFLSDVGGMIGDIWESMPDWAQDLIITIGIVVAAVVVIALLVVAGVVTVIVGIVAAIAAIIAGGIYFAIHGGTDSFNPLHAAAWIFGSALAGGLLAFAIETGAMAVFLSSTWNGIRFLGGKLLLGLRLGWQFTWNKVLVPAFQGIRLFLQFTWSKGLVPVFQGIRLFLQFTWTHGLVPAFRMIATGFRGLLAANNGWMGLLKTGMSGSLVSLAFDGVMGFMTGEWDMKAILLNAAFGFFGAVLGAGLWTRVRGVTGWSRLGWISYGGAVGTGLELLKQWVAGDGINWVDVGITALVFGTLIPLSRWTAGLNISETMDKFKIIDFAEKFPSKFLSGLYKDIIYWNNPDAHPDNNLKDYYHSWGDFINNFKFEFTTGYKNWMWKVFRIYIP